MPAAIPAPAAAEPAGGTQAARVGRAGRSSVTAEGMMETGETLTVATREEFRRWLAGHSLSKGEIWLIFFYKRTGKPSIAYGHAVEEAICYGWIDSQLNRLDEERFVRRFSPRRPGSSWSKYNKERGLRMLRAGRMTEAGMATLPADVISAWKAGE